jgi:hypothetical protein
MTSSKQRILISPMSSSVGEKKQMNNLPAGFDVQAQVDYE